MKEPTRQTFAFREIKSSITKAFLNNNVHFVFTHGHFNHEVNEGEWRL